MEKAANPSIEFSVSGKKSSSSYSDDVVSLKKRMGFHLLENDLGRPFDGGGGRGVGVAGGHDICYGGEATEAVGPAYGGGVSSSRFGGENFATSSSTNSQRFDIFAAAYSTTPLKSPGEMANAAFPFTFAQWKELERQAMIYKCMISSVPVPHDLLFPHSRNYSVAALDSPASLYNVRYSRNGDPEPGRCKRTDGKKWRCSRDVAPHQKYCERHLHRGRPRSRKPVEVKNNGENLKKTRVEHAHVPNSTAGNDKPLLLFNAKNDSSVSAAPYGGSMRDLNTIEGNMGFADGGSSVYGTSSFYHQDYALNVPSYSSFPASETESSTGFIDAWSIHNLDSSNNSGNAESSITRNHGDYLPPSLNLSIAMGAGYIVDQEMGSVDCCDEQSVQDSRWINPVSWEPFARGGPLAEALQLGSSPRDSISNPATTVSSPSGVLHRTLFSHSDGSVCNSPTPAAPAPEIGFHQLN